MAFYHSPFDTRSPYLGQIDHQLMKPISRRGMLGKTGLAATTAAASLSLAAIAAQSSSATAGSGKKKAKAVFTGGHPGDPEYGCGGTIARYTDLGHEVVLLYLNRGDWSDRLGHDPGPVRSAEAAKACEILRARPVFAGQHDGRSIVDQAHYEEFHRLLEGE